MYPGGNVIRVTPTLDTDAISADNVVLFDATEIPNAVASRGGVSKIIGLTILNEDDVQHDIDLVFMQVQTNLGTQNSAVGSGSLWTNALAKAAKVLGVIKIDWDDQSNDLINNLVYTHVSKGTSVGQPLPFMLQAEGGSTSVYVAGISRNGNTQSVQTAADDYEFIFHVEYIS